MANLDIYDDSQNIDALVSTLVSSQQNSDFVEYFDSPINNLSSNSIYDQQSNSSSSENQSIKRTMYVPMATPVHGMMSNGQTNHLSNGNYMIGNNTNNMIALDNWSNMMKSNIVHNEMEYLNSPGGFVNANFTNLSHYQNNTVFNNSNYNNLNCSTNSNHSRVYCNPNLNHITNRPPNGNYINNNHNNRLMYNSNGNPNSNQNMDYYARPRRQIQSQRKNPGFTQLMDIACKNLNQINQSNNHQSNYRNNMNCPMEITNSNLTNSNRSYNQQLNQNNMIYSNSQHYSMEPAYKMNNCNQSNNDRVPNLRSIKGQKQSKSSLISKSQVVTESNISNMIDQIKEQFIELDQRISELVDELSEDNRNDEELISIDKNAKLTIADIAQIGIDLFDKIDKMITEHAEKFKNLEDWLQTSYCALQSWFNLIKSLKYSVQRRFIKLKSNQLGVNLLVKSLDNDSSTDCSITDDLNYSKLLLLFKSTREVNKSIWCMLMFYKHFEILREQSNIECLSMMNG